MRCWACRWTLVLCILKPTTAHTQQSGGGSVSGADPQAAGAPERDASPSSFPRQVGTDFRNAFVSKENWVIVGVGAAAAWGANHYDYRIVRSRFNSEPREGEALDRFYEAGQVLGGGTVQIGGAVAAYGLGRVLSRPGLEALGRDFVRAQIVTQAFTAALKVAVGRERPDHSNHRSFPSGHASASFASAAVLHEHYGMKVGIPAYVVASYIATSRMNEDAHYLSDVVFGSALGIMGGRTVTVRIRDARVSLVPAIPCRGVGLQLIVRRVETPGSGDDPSAAGSSASTASRR